MTILTHARRAFTLIEMLVVIIILVAVMLIAVPSFQAMIASSEAALADSMLKGGLRAGKDAALRSTGDQDGATVFFFEPGGRLTMGVYVKAGVLDDGPGSAPGVQRDVFVPTGLNEPIQLPKGWMVRGYAPPDSTDTGTGGHASDWYEVTPGRPLGRRQGHWLFPETGFYNRNTSSDGSNRQTFMVRFQAGNGVMRMGSSETCLVLAPSAGTAWRTVTPFNDHRADRADDAARFVRRVLDAPTGFGTGALTLIQKRQLLGVRASDTVLARPVSQLALYEESRLAAGIGARVDRVTGCLYQDPNPSGGPQLLGPTFVARSTGTPATFQRDCNLWISGDTNLDGVHRAFGPSGQAEDQPAARIFSIDRYTGALQPVEVQR